jgi:hypothetical protein
MPQSDLLFSRAEHEDLVRFVLEQGAWLVPSRLTSPNPTQITGIGSYRNYVDRAERLFHIQHQEFTRAPLEVRHVRSAEGQDIYYVMQRSGGPTVDLLGPYNLEEGGRARVGGGFISHYPTFWNPITQLNEQAPVEQKAFYGRLVKYIKCHAVRTKAGKRTYWTGLSTAAGLRNGLIALPESWSVQIEIPS